MGLVTAYEIVKSFHNNECQNFFVYGPLGYGKTSYSLQILMEIYKKQIEKDGLVQTLSRYFFHNPLEFLRSVRSYQHQVPAVAWDDAGVWLYYLDFHNPVVKSIAKMMQLIRTKTSSVIFTTPSPTLVLGKLRNFPQTLTIKIKKPRYDEDHPHRTLDDLRVATAYRSWLLPDLQKLRVKKLYEDDFSKMLPNELYEWACKQRKEYVRQIEDEIERHLPKELQLQVPIIKVECGEKA